MYGYNIDITLSFATMPDTYLVQRISICFFFILLLWSDFQTEVPFVDKDKKLNKFGTLEATTFCVIAFNPNLSNKNPMLPQNIKDAYQFFLESLSHMCRLHSRLFQKGGQEQRPLQRGGKLSSRDLPIHCICTNPDFCSLLKLECC